jgi:hypothetical protein
VSGKNLLDYEAPTPAEAERRAADREFWIHFAVAVALAGILVRLILLGASGS